MSDGQPWWKPARTWRPRIRQRQWLNKQRLYGFRGGEDAPRRETDIRDMPAEEEQEQGGSSSSPPADR